MHKARVYFYLDAPGETGQAPVVGKARAGDSAIGFTESEILSFLRDEQHRCEVILVPEKTDECALGVLATKHPRRSVQLKSVAWLT